MTPASPERPSACCAATAPWSIRPSTIGAASSGNTSLTQENAVVPSGSAVTANVA